MDGRSGPAVGGGYCGEEILAVGSDGDIAALIGDDTEVIAAEGGMLVPGFIDAHVHFVAGGAAIASVQLRDAQTPEEFVRRIERFADTAEPGEWINALGRATAASGLDRRGNAG
jgi:predicted amidohydrolase YtcJ